MGKNKRLRAQIEQMMLNQFQQLNQPDPELQRLMGLNQSIIDWSTNPSNSVKDIYKHPTLGSKLPVFQMAKMNRDKGRIGRGIAGLGEHSKSGYASDIALEDDLQRSEIGSGLLESGIQGELEGAQNNMLNLKQLDIGRRTGGNSMLSQLHESVNQRAQNGWSSLIRGMIPGLAQAGIGAML